jgi:hypothetical protein
MQLCSHCGHQNREGVVFCEKCGVALVPVPLSTRRLQEGEEAGGTDELGSDGVLILQIGTEAAPIMVQIHSELILGRVTEQAEGKAYINLTEYNAVECGVSRQHVRLQRDNRAVYVTDLNSTNGTKVNGEVLPASVEKRLRDGDELLLGKLKVFVYFKV